jgi:hypothetical protein
MNTHIELVKKWLADPESVTQQELKDNRDAAKAAYYADYDYDTAAAMAAADAAAYADAAAAAADFAAKAEHWVKRYEELTEQGE